MYKIEISVRQAMKWVRELLGISQHMMIKMSIAKNIESPKFDLN